MNYVCPILIMWLLIYLDKPKALELRYYIGLQEFWSVVHFLFFSGKKCQFMFNYHGGTNCHLCRPSGTDAQWKGEHGRVSLAAA